MNAPLVARLLRELADAIEADAPVGTPATKRRARRARPEAPRPRPKLDDATRAIAHTAMKRAGMLVP